MGKTYLHTQILAALLPLRATSWHEEPEELLDIPQVLPEPPWSGQCLKLTYSAILATLLALPLQP